MMKYSPVFNFLLFLGIGFTACKKDTPSSPEPPVPSPRADFSFTITNPGVLPAIVNFTDASSDAATVKWNFGDGQSSDDKKPSHQYAGAGTYTVKLIASGAGGKDSITKEVVITLKATPLIDKSIVVYLITPGDKKYNPDYLNVLKTTVLNLQAWYKDQLKNNKTFVLNSFIADTLRGLHDSTWYNSNNGSISGTDPRFYGYYNTYYEMQQLLGADFNTSKYVYFVYVAAPGGGAGAGGFCAMGDQDLKGLLGKNKENLDPNRWIGGGGHELGHALGLPHPDNQNSAALMWTGYLTYPNCILQQADKDILNASPFIR